MMTQPQRKRLIKANLAYDRLKVRQIVWKDKPALAGINWVGKETPDISWSYVSLQIQFPSLGLHDYVS